MFKKIGVGDLSSSSSTYRSLLLGIALVSKRRTSYIEKQLIGLCSVHYERPMYSNGLQRADDDDERIIPRLHSFLGVYQGVYNVTAVQPCSYDFEGRDLKGNVFATLE